MNTPSGNINDLLGRLDSLLEKQTKLQEEMLLLKKDFLSFKGNEREELSVGPDHVDKFESSENSSDERLELEEIYEAFDVPSSGIHRRVPYDDPSREHTQSKPDIEIEHKELPVTEKSNLEKFIGENLINKIGIAITVLGVGIGAKYSIENDLISPLTRIVIGYLFGLGLTGFAIWLKAKYENFSAVLLSGGMATFYLITFSAYSFYGLFPQVFAFVLMVLFTIFTVIAAIHYNRQVIAHIGLVGAYAVPFLLSEGEGKVGILFSYMAIINGGILIISFQRYWKPLFYSSFFFTWIIFSSWYFSRYQVQEHFVIAFTFLFVFFIIFYLAFLAYKVVRKEQFGVEDVLLLLLNSFLFFGLGYSLLSDHTIGEKYLGLFTLLNAFIHFGVCAFIFNKKLADKNLFNLLAGLVLVFITIAVPIQLDGNGVTLVWAGLAVLLFWIGRKNKVAFYESLSYPLIILTFISLLHDWSLYENLTYNSYDNNSLKVVFNVQFLSSIMLMGAFMFLQYVNMKSQYQSHVNLREALIPLFNFIIPGILIIISYYTFRIEIERYWDQRYLASAMEGLTEGDFGNTYTYHDYSLTSIKNIWVLNYTMLFLSILCWLNIFKLRNKAFSIVLFFLNALTTAVFLGLGLYLLSELRDNYLGKYLQEYYTNDKSFLILRYISFTLFAGFLFTFFRLVKSSGFNITLKKSFDYILHVSILWLLSSELINVLELMGNFQSNKLALSILWGIYALFLIVLGIWKKKKNLRLAAMVLFGITLLKLFFYDISHLDTISKTIVFVSLGLLLLIISFLYNKYKVVITDEI